MLQTIYLTILMTLLFTLNNVEAFNSFNDMPPGLREAWTHGTQVEKKFNDVKTGKVIVYKRLVKYGVSESNKQKENIDNNLPVSYGNSPKSLKNDVSFSKCNNYSDKPFFELPPEAYGEYCGGESAKIEKEGDKKSEYTVEIITKLKPNTEDGKGPDKSNDDLQISSQRSKSYLGKQIANREKGQNAYVKFKKILNKLKSGRHATKKSRSRSGYSPRTRRRSGYTPRARIKTYTRTYKRRTPQKSYSFKRKTSRLKKHRRQVSSFSNAKETQQETTETKTIKYDVNTSSNYELGSKED
jgi:hypothetical protein